MATQYILALIDRDGDNYGIHFPDYPGCISGGDSFRDAIDRGGNALSFHLYGLAQDGDDIPVPQTPETWLSTPEVSADLASGTLPALIDIELPGKAVRVNISIEEGLLSQVDNAAKTSGQSRSAFLAEAARTRLRGAA